MPDDIARHMIDGFIGPGPFAQEPIELSPVGELTDDMIGYNDIIGYGFGCHCCGTRDPGTKSGSFILDHELPETLNFGNWTYRFYPHCQTCVRRQGGHVNVIRIRLRREGFIP